MSTLLKKYDDLENEVSQAFKSFKDKEIIFLTDDELELEKDAGTLDDSYEYRNEFTGEIQSAALISVKDGQITVIELEEYNVRVLDFSDLADIRDRIKLIEEITEKTKTEP